MSKRWSKLQSRLYNLMDNDINFQIHCCLYEMNSNDGCHGSKLPRYFITIDKDIVFDYPSMFYTTLRYGFNSYPWDTDISDISNVIEGYIQTPVNNVIENDKWGITDILRVCDRRVGKRKLKEILNSTDNEVIIKIINKRLKGN